MDAPNMVRGEQKATSLHSHDLKFGRKSLLGTNRTVGMIFSARPADDQHRSTCISALRSFLLAVSIVALFWRIDCAARFDLGGDFSFVYSDFRYPWHREMLSTAIVAFCELVEIGSFISHRFVSGLSQNALDHRVSREDYRVCSNSSREQNSLSSYSRFVGV